MQRLSMVSLLGWLAVQVACAPAPVESLQIFLSAYVSGDVPVATSQVARNDRTLFRQGMVDLLGDAPTSTVALALPPRPLESKIVDVGSKADGRWVLNVKSVLKNPLPYSSERLGQQLPKMPKTRNHRRKYLLVDEGDGWFVKLDLEAVLARVRFARQVDDRIQRGQLDRAEESLSQVPPSPDDPNAQDDRDRIEDTFRGRIDLARKQIQQALTSTPTRD